MFHIHDDCLFHILSFVPPLDLLKNCLLVSEQFHHNVRKVSFKLDFSANLQQSDYSITLKEGINSSDNSVLIRFDVVDLLNCQYLERLESLNLSFNNIRSYGAKLISESKYLKNLTELVLNGCTIKGDGLEYLLSSSFIPNLRGLGLSRCGLTEEDAKKLTTSKLDKLEYLHLSSNNIGNQGFWDLICHFANNLKELDISLNYLDDDHSIAEDLIPESVLESLDLSMTRCNSAFMKMLFAKTKKLKKLSVRRTDLDDGLKVTVLDNLPELTYLDISGFNANPLLNDLAYCGKLKTLVMNNCRLKKFDQFKSDNYMAGIEHLSLLNNSFTDILAVSIAEIAKKKGINLQINATIASGHKKNYKKLLQDLKDLNISKLNVGNAIVGIIGDNLSSVFNQFEIYLSDFIPSSFNASYFMNVKSIDLYDSEIRDEGFRILFTNNCMSNLRELNAAYCAIKEIPSPEECHENLKSLTKLDVKYNLFGDDGLCKIVNNPHLCNLRELNVEIGGITKEGIKHLVSSPYMSNLISLNLDGAGGGDSKNYGIKANEIGDEGFEILLNSNLNNLVDLCVSCNGLGNESAKVLVNHKGVKNLVEIVMFENSFNDEVIPYLTNPAIAKFHTLRVLYHEISQEGVDQITNSTVFEGLSYSI